MTAHYKQGDNHAAINRFEQEGNIKQYRRDASQVQDEWDDWEYKTELYGKCESNRRRRRIPKSWREKE
jgi:hypothetical protein